MIRRCCALALAAVLVVSGCAAIPHEGAVEFGDRNVGPVEPLFPLAEGPRPGDGPTVMMGKFLQASSAGLLSDFAVAREFLSVQARANWNPTSHVWVYDSSEITPDYDADSSVVTYQVPVVAVLDESGRLTETAEDVREELEFSLIQDGRGQWRISGLDDGVLISEAFLTSYYRPVELVFASEDMTTVVPEVRWFPNNALPSVVTRELMAGPSPWLADAVVTGFPVTASLEVSSVVVTEGVAAVPLTAESVDSLTSRSLVEQQLRLTLTSLPSVTDVLVTVGGLPIGGDDSVQLTRASVPDQNAVAFVGDRLGLWDGEQLWTVPSAVGRLPENSRGLARPFPLGTVAFVVGDSQLVTASGVTAGEAALVPYSEEAETPPEVMDYTTVWEGQSLVDPRYDRFGWLWTAERSAADQWVVVGDNGDVVELNPRSLEGRSMQSFAFSRDGARVAMLTRQGTQQILEVAGVARTPDGTPLSLTTPVDIGVRTGVAAQVVWLDDTTLAVLGVGTEESPPSIWLVSVGGRTVSIEAVPGVTGLTARYGERSLKTVSDDESVRDWSGTAWTTVVVGARELAYAG